MVSDVANSNANIGSRAAVGCTFLVVVVVLVLLGGLAQ